MEWGGSGTLRLRAGTTALSFLYVVINCPDFLTNLPSPVPREESPRQLINLPSFKTVPLLLSLMRNIFS